MKNIVPLDAKIEWGSMWVVIGDALGLPLENKKNKEIVEIFHEEYLPISHHGQIVKYKEEKKGKIDYKLEDTWVISDDTILTLAWIHAINQKSQLDIANLFYWHKMMHNKYGGYWFSGTVDNKLRTYDGGADMSTLWAWLPSYGNWVFMKQFPYAAYFFALKHQSDLESVFSLQEYDDAIREITLVTHKSAIAQLVSILHNKTLIYLLWEQPTTLDMRWCLQKLLLLAPIYEEKIISPNIEEYNPDADMKITPILQKLLIQLDEIEVGRPYSYDKILDTYLVQYADPQRNKGMMPGYHVASTFGIVYALFLQNQTFQALLDAIRIWYDTDSQSSIVGSMIGALKGQFYEQYYVDWIKDIWDIQEAIKDFKVTLQNIKE